MYENYPMTKQGQKGRIPFKCYSSKGFFMDSFKQIKGCFQVINGILLQKLFWPTVRKKWSNDREKN